MLNKIKRRLLLFICLFAGQNSKITKANSVGFAEQIAQKNAFAIFAGQKSQRAICPADFVICPTICPTNCAHSLNETVACR